MSRHILLLFVFCCLFAPVGYGRAAEVESHGLAIHYRVFGEGRPLLIIGGGPGDAADRYVDLCELLSPHVQCILVEQRGTGRSRPAVQDASTISIALTLDDFEAVRRRLGLSEWAVLGFSYGGYLASLYAHDFPASVSALVLLGSMGLNWDGLERFEDNVVSRLGPYDRELLDYWSAPERMKVDFRQAVTETIRAKMPGYFFDRRKSLTVSQTMKADDFDFTMGEWIYRDAQARKLDLAVMDNPFKNPVLIVQGRQDPGGEATALGLAAHYARSRLVFIEKCGHYSWIEQPRQVLDAVAGFLAQKPVPTGTDRR